MSAHSRSSPRAPTMRIREGGRVIDAVPALATGMNNDGAASSSACAWQLPKVGPHRTKSSPISSLAA
ncbi:MAG: hypothetical protein E6Z70_10280, partial [Cutibacterium avidum]|nr:hypothetical protein [Cutibacterium avidum]